MPIRYEIDADANLVTLTATEKIGYDHVIEAYTERAKDPAYRPGMHLLFDGRRATFEINAAETAKIVTFFESRREERGRGFRFALVSEADLTYGMGRMFEAYADELPEDIRVFRDFGEARSWAQSGDDQ